MNTPAALFPGRSAFFPETELLSFDFRIWEPLESPCTWDRTQVEFTPLDNAGNPLPSRAFSPTWRRRPEMAARRHPIHMTRPTPKGRYAWRARAIHVRKNADQTRVHGLYTTPAALRIGSPSGLSVLPEEPAEPPVVERLDWNLDRLWFTEQPVTVLNFCGQLPTPAPMTMGEPTKGASETIALRVRAGSFDSPCTIDATEWQVTDAMTGQSVYQSGFSAADITGTSIPKSRLQQDASYTWQARFKSTGRGFGDSDVLSSWSAPTPLALP